MIALEAQKSLKFIDFNLQEGKSSSRFALMKFEIIESIFTSNVNSV